VKGEVSYDWIKELTKDIAHTHTHAYLLTVFSETPFVVAVVSTKCCCGNSWPSGGIRERSVFVVVVAAFAVTDAITFRSGAANNCFVDSICCVSDAKRCDVNVVVVVAGNDVIISLLSVFVSAITKKRMIIRIVIRNRTLFQIQAFIQSIQVQLCLRSKQNDVRRKQLASLIKLNILLTLRSFLFALSRSSSSCLLLR